MSSHVTDEIGFVVVKVNISCLIVQALLAILERATGTNYVAGIGIECFIILRRISKRYDVLRIV